MMRIDTFLGIFMMVPIILLGVIHPAQDAEAITALRFFLLGVQMTCLVTTVLGLVREHRR